MALTDKLTAIADSIRKWTENSNSMSLDTMADIISNNLTFNYKVKRLDIKNESLNWPKDESFKIVLSNASKGVYIGRIGDEIPIDDWSYWEVMNGLRIGDFRGVFQMSEKYSQTFGLTTSFNPYTGVLTVTLIDDWSNL